MANAKLLSDENKRFVLLEECEKRIFSAYRRGMQATRDIAKELLQIEEQELYKERGYESFRSYVERALRIDYRSAGRWMEVEETLESLEGEGIELPLNQSQAEELARLPLEHRAGIWRQILDTCGDGVVTVNAVRSAVDLADEELRTQRSAPAGGGAGLDIDLEPDTGEEETSETEEEPEPAKASKNGSVTEPARVLLSEEGERALERIKRFCGESVASAIEKGTVAITEAHLIKWAEQPDATVKNLAYYIVDLRWKFPRAFSYENRVVNGFTTLDELIMLCRARSGRISLHHQDFKVTIEYATAVAA